VIKLSDYVMRFVVGLGVRHVFLVTGGGAMHLNDSLARCGALQPICNSHEQASAICAEAYAKASDSFGVALVTTGPGGTNAVTGVVGAWLDSTPCLILSGQVKRPDRMVDSDGTPRGVRQMGLQEVDITSIVRPVTKYAVTVTEPQEIRYHLERAVHIARSGRPGPVWIDIPIDVQGAQIDETALPGFTPEPEPEPAQASLAEPVRAVIEALNRAERPLLLVGNGVRLAGAADLLRAVAERTGVPVATTWCAADLVGADHPLFIGRPGTLAARGANFALQNCDFLLAIGARLDFSITGYAPERLARAAHKVAVDVDPAELAKLHPHIHQPIAADAKAFLTELLAQGDAIAAIDRGAWRRHGAEWHARYPLITDAHRAAGPVSLFHFAETMAAVAAPDDLMVSGSSGAAIEMFLFAHPTRTGQRVVHTAGLGAMGYGLPTSIGVCLAGGGRRTICVDGDGGFQFNIQELATVAHHRLPIKFFVFNNDGYASIRASQTNFFGKANIGCDGATGVTVPELSRLAAAYGLTSAVISDQSDLAGQLRRILDLPGPVLCDVRVLPDESRAPRLSSVQRPDGSFVSRPLEDLWPFLERDEFRSNMIVPPLEEV